MRFSRNRAASPGHVASPRSGAPLRGVITHCRVRGTRNGRPWGIISVATDCGEISVRGNADCSPGDETGVKVLRYVAFTDGRKVDEGELV